MNERAAPLRQRSAPAVTSQLTPMAGRGGDLAPTAAPPSLGHDFAQVSPLRPQAKLTVSQPGDPQEQEAEQVADKVMRAETPPAPEEEQGREEQSAGRIDLSLARQVMRAPGDAPSPVGPASSVGPAPSGDPNTPLPGASPMPLDGGAGGGSATNISVNPTTRAVSAPNLSQLWDVMTRSGTRESASVLPKLQPAPQYEYDAGNHVTKAVITVIENKEMPQWTELPQQCPPIQAEWNRFFGVLDAHENNHVAIDRKHFTNLHARLIGKEQSAAWKIVDDEVTAADQDNSAYDAKSANSVNEGGSINSAVQCAPEKVKSTSTGGPSDDNAGLNADPGSAPALPPTAQAKLMVSRPGDSFEQEAERLADQVMRMPAQSVQRACAGPGHCDCPACRQGEEKRLARAADDDNLLADGSHALADDAGAQVTGVVGRGGGQSLGASTRAFMEPRFGHDFSRIRIHTDQRAAQSAAAVSARAYAVGSDVVFGAGQYAPGTPEGRHLLAHELTHTIQQGQSPALVQRVGPYRPPGPPPTPDTLPPTPGSPTAPAGPVPPGQHDGQLVATWGWAWKTKLTADKRDARDFDSLAKASAYGASITPAAVFQEESRFVVYHLKYTALHSFTYENAKDSGDGTDCDMRAVTPVLTIVTEDGVSILPHQLKGEDGKPKDDYNSPMEAKDTLKPGEDPFGAHKDVFGAGLGSVVDREKFLTLFSVAMHDAALAALDRSQKDAEQKQKEMTGSALPSQDKDKIADVAKQLAAVEAKLEEAQRFDTRHRGPYAREEHEADEAQKQAKVAALERERAEIRLKYPLLSQVDAADFVKKSEKEQVQMLGAGAGDVLKNIKTTRDNVLTGSLELWAVPSLVQTTQAGLGVMDDGRKKWVAEKCRQVDKSKKEAQEALVVFQIVFSIAAVAIGGPVGAAFAVGALGASMADALLVTQQFVQDQAAAGTDVNKDKALVPSDLTGRWAALVVAWVGVGLSYADAAYWVRSVKTGAVTLDEAASTLAKTRSMDEGALKSAGRLEKISLDPEALRKTLLSAMPEDVAAEAKSLSVQVLTEKDFAARFGPQDAVTVFSPTKDGTVTATVFVKDTGNPLAVRAQAPSIEAQVSASRGPKGPLMGPTTDTGQASRIAEWRTKLRQLLNGKIAAGTVVLAEDMSRARQIYMEWVTQDPGREVALWYHPDSRDMAVVQGTGDWKGGSVPWPTQDSRWVLVEHFHPERNFAVQFPSEADYRVIMRSEGAMLDPQGRRMFQFDPATGAPLTNPIKKRIQSTIMYRNPATGQFHYSYFGYDPAFENSALGGYFLNIELKGGARLDLNFRDFTELQAQVNRLQAGDLLPR